MQASFDLSIVPRVVAAIGLLASAWFYLAALWSAHGAFRRSPGRRAAQPPTPGATGEAPGVTVLKPLKGVDAGMLENLESFCRQDYPNFQIVLGVADPDDPAVSVVRMLRARFPRLRVDLVVDSRVYGTNYKISNLHNMYRAAIHPVIVIADSDIRVPPDYLRRIVAPLADREIGVVTCLYRAASTGGLPTLLEKLFVDTDFANMVLVARLVETPSYAFGATIAVRRAVLDEIGGFLSLADYLADDYYLGHRVAQRGYRLALSDLIVETVLAVGSWRRLLDHQLRWARTYKSCRPAGYFGSVFTHGMAWACVNMVVNDFGPRSCLAALGLAALRVTTAALLSSRYLRSPLRWYEALLVPVKDLLVSAVWLLAFAGNTVRWSGHRFRVLKDGRMLRLDPEPVAPSVPQAAFSRPEERERRAAVVTAQAANSRSARR